MRSINFPLALLSVLLLVLTAGCGNINARKAVKVNDVVIGSHQELMGTLGSFIDALEGRDADAISRSLQSLKAAAESGLQTTASQQPVKCDFAFLPAAGDMFGFYAEAADGEYATIASMYSRDSISMAEFDSLQLVIRQVEEAQQEADRAFLAAQQEFARSCGFKLVRNVD
jgi:hypothetical protein